MSINNVRFKRSARLLVEELLSWSKVESRYASHLLNHIFSFGFILFSL